MPSFWDGPVYSRSGRDGAEDGKMRAVSPLARALTATFVVLAARAEAGPPEPPMSDAPPRRSASRIPPVAVAPVVKDGVRYEAPRDAPGVLVAVDAKTSKERWRLRVADRFVDPRREADVQLVFLTSLALSPGGDALLLDDELGRRHAVDLAKRRARAIGWPAQVRFMDWHPTPEGWAYRVELRVINTSPRTLRLDGPSVAEGGDLENDLFRVTVDGAPVDYQGKMAKRAPPGRFVEVAPGQTYQVQVELGREYPVPPGPHRVTVAFEHTNHFSPDAFVMQSAPVAQDFAAPP